MTYRIEYTPAALANLDCIPNADRKRIVKKIDLLATDPFPSGCKRLQGFSLYFRLRVGDYRVVYTFRRNVVTISITAIGHRKDIYRKLAKLLK